MKFIFPFLVLIAFQGASFACTVAEIGTGQNVTVAQNLGWFWKMDAGLVVNKRGVSKEGLRINAADGSAKWVSKYGSISINPVGREFPLGGMNEKGLSVQGLHSYDGRYETTSRLPVLNMFQWVQYQLDTSATVDEAIEHAKAVRPTDNQQLTLHYFICDATGRCAVFEWLSGNLEIREDSSLAVRVFANTNYETSISEYQKCASSDCPLPNDGPNFSLQRFVQAARLVKSYDGEAEPVSYLFHLLDVVK
ncbi:MAG: linear amide C-N hydrolase, partial [Bdellovibrionota bacterium]